MELFCAFLQGIYSFAPCHSFACDAAGGPGRLEIEAAGDAVEVEAFPRKVKVGDSLALHPAKIHVL